MDPGVVLSPKPKYPEKQTKGVPFAYFQSPRSYPRNKQQLFSESRDSRAGNPPRIRYFTGIAFITHRL